MSRPLSVHYVLLCFARGRRVPPLDVWLTPSFFPVICYPAAAAAALRSPRVSDVSSLALAAAAAATSAATTTVSNVAASADGDAAPGAPPAPPPPALVTTKAELFRAIIRSKDQAADDLRREVPHTRGRRQTGRHRC